MAKRNTSNNPLFREMRELEAKCLAAGAIEDWEIKTSGEMRREAWECYLVGRIGYLEKTLEGQQYKGGGQ